MPMSAYRPQRQPAPRGHHTPALWAVSILQSLAPSKTCFRCDTFWKVRIHTSASRCIKLRRFGKALQEGYAASAAPPASMGAMCWGAPLHQNGRQQVAHPNHWRPCHMTQQWHGHGAAKCAGHGIANHLSGGCGTPAMRTTREEDLARRFYCEPISIKVSVIQSRAGKGADRTEVTK